MSAYTRVVCVSLAPAAPSFIDIYNLEVGATYEAVVGEWGHMAPADAITERDLGTVLICAEVNPITIQAAVGWTNPILSHPGVSM